MEMSEKQLLYLRLLDIILPYIRNMETRSLWNRLTFRSLYEEAELVHNISRCIRNRDFSHEDIYWLNIQAKNYCEYATKRPLHGIVVGIVNEIIGLIPPELRKDLEWSGPRLVASCGE
jgi:hypothetical protein